MTFPATFLFLALLAAPALPLTGCRSSEATAPPNASADTSWRTLTPAEERVIVDQGTERAFTGAYHDHKEAGTYRCKRCGTPLFASDAKFDSGTGWPSFDQALDGAVREVTDADGRRTEIVCARCGGHLGHVFKGEGFTDNSVRHCVNSVSLDFAAAGAPPAEATAYFAGGCFWGVEYHLEALPGVIRVESGYMGGHAAEPTYRQVVNKGTGHLETVRVVYDPARISYEAVARRFFEIHDPTQEDGQGPDLGPQYLSAVFYADDAQKIVAERLVTLLEARGYDVATTLRPAGRFWPAETYHQDYYERTGKAPYCHTPVSRFGES